MIARTIGARLLAAAPTVFGVLVCVFVVLHLAPGDPVEAMLGEGAPAADREALRRAWGLDKPLWAQFALYLADLARGDWGVSLIHGEPVLAMVAERLPATLLLAASALALAVGLGVPLG
ncbi:MAG: ABC transporter permease, partial [Zetaproteobacteria bacterium]